MTRHVSNLIYARRLLQRPAFIPQSRPRGFKALGTRYESLVSRNLPGSERGLWWEYSDANGLGFCQTDFIVIGRRYVLIIECKHTWTPTGMEQLQDLYLPVVSLALGLPTIGVQLCKHLVTHTHSTALICPTLEDAVETAKARNAPTTLHWRGLGPIPRQTPAVTPASDRNPQQLENSYGRQAAA